MKRLILLFSILAGACATPNALVGRKSLQGAGQPVSDLPIVISANGLRLRDLPDTMGSQELTIIPFGAEFHEYYCIEARGTAWAFGAYQDDQTNYLGYVAARYLSGGCDG